MIVAAVFVLIGLALLVYADRSDSEDDLKKLERRLMLLALDRERRKP